MKHPFATFDVFTTQRFAGNPLAVVFEADAIDGAAMQAIAREFGHPETVFVLKAEMPGHAARIRIFTPAIEMPFAGHPTVGTAVALGLRAGWAAPRNLVLEEKIGPVRCRVAAADAGRAHAQFELPQLPQEAGAPPPNTALAAGLGLSPDDIGCDGFAPTRWSAGVAYTFVPVRGLDAARRSYPDLARWDAAFEAQGRTSAYVFCDETVEPGSTVHARMFAPRMGVHEDAATGSAAAAFAGVYARALRLADGDHRVTIEQGIEMGRPSRIDLTLTVRASALAAATVGGEAVMVTQGTIEV